MSLLRKGFPVVLWMAVFGSLASRATAQDKLFYDPFCAHDIDLFDPIHCDCPDYAEPNYGWFFTYDRLHLNGSRPSEAAGLLSVDGLAIPPQTFPPVPPALPQPGEGRMSAQKSNDYSGDWTDGNRFDFGFMHENGGGIWFVVRKLNNPNVQRFEDNLNLQEREEEDLLEDPIGQSLLTFNSFNFYGFEVNKVWRMPISPNGMVFEPFAGPRYVRIRDHFDRADFFRDEPSPPTSGGPAGGTLTFTQASLYEQRRTTTDNDLFGGQFGLRTNLRKGRWVLSSDIRGFAFHNFRDRERVFLDEFTSQIVTGTYDATGNLTATAVAELDPVNGQSTFTDESGRFVWGGELRLEAMFEITKSFGIRGAAEVLVFADGIGRGEMRTDDRFNLAGFSLGFAFNR